MCDETGVVVMLSIDAKLICCSNIQLPRLLPDHLHGMLKRIQCCCGSGLTCGQDIRFESDCVLLLFLPNESPTFKALRAVQHNES